MNTEKAAAASSETAERVPHRCLVRLRGIYHSLKKAERNAADYLLAAPDAIHQAGVVEFSTAAGCSQATVVRLAQRLGYDGFPALRNAFAAPEPEVPYRDIAAADKPQVVLRKVFANSVQALQDTLAAIDPAQYDKSVDALVAAKSLAFFGLGNAAVVAREAYHKFLRIGFPCHTAEDPDLQLIILRNHLDGGDMLVAVWESPPRRSLRPARAIGPGPGPPGPPRAEFVRLPGVGGGPALANRRRLVSSRRDAIGSKRV